jgi:peptide/nickel transport system permease protein
MDSLVLDSGARAAELPAAPESEQGWRPGLRRLARNRLSLAGLLIIALYAAGPLLAPWITPYPPLATDDAATLRPPGAAHVLGTDQFGRDILARVLYAARLDLFIALSAVGRRWPWGHFSGPWRATWGAGWTRW